MKYKISKSDFTFIPVSHGRYKVIYKTPSKREYYQIITDMELIDATKNTEIPKRKDLLILKRHCQTFKRTI